jgi:hypothetical protein
MVLPHNASETRSGMPPPKVVTTSPTAQYVFERQGGAIVQARLSIWSDPGLASQKRVEVLFFEDSLDDIETFTRTLPKGVYTCVLLVFIREDLNGAYAYKHRVGGKLVADGQGDVNDSLQPGEGSAFRHEYGLVLA